LRPQTLDGNWPVQKIVIAEKNLGHAPFADFALNRIAPVDG
jgi:hypothetical protein